MTQKPFAIDLSYCGGFLDPQLQMENALTHVDIHEFRVALDMNADPRREDNQHLSAFERALKTKGCAEFVEECLKHGCSPNYINVFYKKTALSFATDSRDPEILAIMLQNKGLQIDRKYEQLTPLNSLTKNLAHDNVADVIACIKLLLRYGASANIPDQRDMTPILYTLKNRKIDDARKREIIQIFLAECGNELDLDTNREGEARSILQRDYKDLPLPDFKQGNNEVNVESMLRHMRHGDEEKFLQEYEFYKQMVLAEQERQILKAVPPRDDICLLTESIKRGMHEAFDKIMNSGLNVNINSVDKVKSPVEIAVIWGNWRALQKLLQHPDLEIKPKKHQLLTAVIPKLEEPSRDHVDYQKCFYALLNSKHVNINETDPSGTTALHYAVKYRHRKAEQELLKRGAYIGSKSLFNDLPIDGMHPEVLEEHLDSCVTTNGLKSGDENFEIIMNFTNLIPHDGNDSKTATAHKNLALRDEMAPIAFIAKSKDYRHLLQHPLITSFLYLKWHRLSVVFYVNFMLYAFFAVSIITHTILKFRGSDHKAVTTLFGVFAWIGIIYMILRELTQFIMSPLHYFRSLINYMELLLIILSIMTCTEPSYELETQRVIAVFTMLLVAIELCLLVGSLPILSISTHMLMLRAVCKSFLKIFTLYSIFVITFGLCFYILFGKPEVDENGLPKPNVNENFNKFTNPVAAFIKTIVMLTGEFDAGDIDFDTVYSYLIFLLFVFFMSIVLFNLLNGLAVSDTQAIKSQAELNGSICRANLLTRYEEVLTGRTGRVSYLVNLEPFNSICRRLINLQPFYMNGSQISILPNDGNRVMISIASNMGIEMRNVKSAAALGNGKNDFSLLPMDNGNEKQRKLLDPPIPCCCGCVSGKCSEMDNRTVKLAMALIEQKLEAQKEKERQLSTERRLQGIEVQLRKLYEILEGMKISQEERI